MKLNKFESFVMNSPVKRFIHRNLELPLFKRLLRKHHIDLAGKAMVDAGCGSGYGTELLIREYKPSNIAAFDFMPEEVELAKKRNPGVNIFVGDLASIALPSAEFDAVFIFGVLHHVPEWRSAIREVARILKPGGVMLIQEPGRVIIKFTDIFGMDHPLATQFRWTEFEAELRQAGFTILERRNLIIPGIRSYIAVHGT